jgi:hypothetical protein
MITIYFGIGHHSLLRNPPMKFIWKLICCYDGLAYLYITMYFYADSGEAKVFTAGSSESAPLK